VPGRFTVGNGFAVGKIAPFVEGAGFQTRELAAAEGFLPGVGDGLIAMRSHDPAAFEAALKSPCQLPGTRRSLGWRAMCCVT
jgi:hypothetical protein